MLTAPLLVVAKCEISSTSLLPIHFTDDSNYVQCDQKNV